MLPCFSYCYFAITMFKSYRPKIWLIIADIGIILINIVLVLGLFPLTSRSPFQKYQIPAIFFIAIWILTSYLFNRYISLRRQLFENAAFNLLYTSIINFSLFAGYILVQDRSPFSQYVLYSIMAGIFLSEYVFLFIYFAYRYAVQYDVPPFTHEIRENAQLIKCEPLSEEEKENRKKHIVLSVNDKIYEYLNKNISLYDSSTNVMTEFDVKTLQDLPDFTFDTYIQLQKLNRLRGINKMFFLANEKLPDNGKIVVMYNTKSTIKGNIYKTYPVIIRDIVYLTYYFIHRLLPKFFLTQRLYFDITQGKRRILSKTEVLGRLVFCGFEIEKQTKINDLNIVVAKRMRQAEPIKPRRNYGPFIKLKRFGKDGKLFYVYKVRTMHPYSEFIQTFVYEQNDLQEGGKFNKDIRVTTLGRFMRKYWIDELPMLLNLIKGDMKLIGVRPLSAHFFSLYSRQLQQKRIKFRPGLLPPFYADMPKTLDEIQESELRYLNQCEKKGVFLTDFKYFFLILKNILFSKVHSA